MLCQVLPDPQPKCLDALEEEERSHWRFPLTLGGGVDDRRAVLYMTDPADKTVLWRYPAGGEGMPTVWDGPAKFERLFVASDVDRAIAQALGGDTAWIDQMNGAPDFNWTQVIRDSHGSTRAVLKIFGNPNESYRDYQAVAQAAAERKKA